MYFSPCKIYYVCLYLLSYISLRTLIIKMMLIRMRAYVDSYYCTLCNYRLPILSRYNVQWYIAPLRVQKLILFLLLKGSKTLSLNFGGVVLLSLKFFATVKVISYACYINYYYIICLTHAWNENYIRRIWLQLTKASLSYFTVMYSMQE